MNKFIIQNKEIAFCLVLLVLYAIFQHFYEKHQRKSIDPKYFEMAKYMMKIMMCEYGVANFYFEERYPDHHVLRVALAAKRFFQAHPQFNNANDIEEICIGDPEENDVRYGTFSDYAPLRQSLTQYVNNGLLLVK